MICVLRHFHHAAALLLIALLPLSACAEQAFEVAEESSTRMTINEAIPGTVVGDDALSLAPQPTLADLDAWAAAGVTTVINMRSMAEIDALPFDEAAEVTKRGMTYVVIPMGGADGVSPDIVQALGLTLDNAAGKVVAHCRSGTRAAHAYGALLVSRGDLEREALDDSLGWTAPLSQGTLDALLGAPMAGE
jgi:uncharacterized protein (TIGR01244 family)